MFKFNTKMKKQTIEETIKKATLLGINNVNDLAKIAIERVKHLEDLLSKQNIEIEKLLSKNKNIETKQRNSIEAVAITTYKTGQSFYTSKQDKDITAIAGYYKVKVKTERLVCLDCKTMNNINRITKVTII